MPSLSSNTQRVRWHFSIAAVGVLFCLAALAGALGVSSLVFADNGQEADESSTPVVHAVNLVPAEHGTVFVEGHQDELVVAVSSGEEVTLNFVPEDGYYTSGLTLNLPFTVGVDNPDKQAEIESQIIPFSGKLTDGKVTFLMPNHDVNVTSEYTQGTLEIMDQAAIDAIPDVKETIKNGLNVQDVQLGPAEQLRRLFGEEFDTSGVVPVGSSLSTSIQVVEPDVWTKFADLEPNALVQFFANGAIGTMLDDGSLLADHIPYAEHKMYPVYTVNGIANQTVYSPELKALGGDVLYAYLTSGKRFVEGEPYYKCNVDVEKGFIYLPDGFDISQQEVVCYLILANSDIDAAKKLDEAPATVTVQDTSNENEDEKVVDAITVIPDDSGTIVIPLPQADVDSEISVTNSSGAVVDSSLYSYDAETNSISLSEIVDSSDVVVHMRAPAVEELPPDAKTAVIAGSEALGDTIVHWGYTSHFKYGGTVEHQGRPMKQNTYWRKLSGSAYENAGYDQPELWCGDPDMDAPDGVAGIWSGYASTAGVSATLKKFIWYCGPALGEINWGCKGQDAYAVRHHVIAKARGTNWTAGIAGTPYQTWVENAYNQIDSKRTPDYPASFKAWIIQLGAWQDLVGWDYNPVGYVKFHKLINPSQQSMVAGDVYYRPQDCVFQVSGPESFEVRFNDNCWSVGDGCNYNGDSAYYELEPGTYSIQEKQAGQGMLLDANTYSFTVTGGKADSYDMPSQINVQDKVEIPVKLTKDINPLYKSIYNSDPTLQGALSGGVEVKIHFDGRNGGASITPPVGDNTKYTDTLGAAVKFSDGKLGDEIVTLRVGSSVTGHLYPAGSDEGGQLSGFGANFQGWYAVEEIDKDPSSGMLFSYYVEPHDPTTGARIYPCFQVTANATSAVNFTVLNIPLIPVDFYKKAYDSSGTAIDPSSSDYANIVKGATFRIWHAEHDTLNSQGMSPQPQKKQSIDQTSDDIWNGTDLSMENFNGVLFDNPDTDHGVKSENGIFSWVSGRKAQTDGSENEFAKSIEDSVAGDTLTKYVCDDSGHFRAYLLPPEVYVPDLGNFHGTYVLEELVPPLDYLLPHGYVNGQLQLIYPMFQLKTPFTGVPAVDVVDEPIPGWDIYPKTVITPYASLLEDEASLNHYSQSGAKFRIFLDKNQGADDAIMQLHWDNGIISFGDPDYTKQVMTPDEAIAAGLNPGAIGQGVNDTWLFSNDDEEWGLLPSGAFTYNGGDFNGWYCLDEVIAPQGLLWPHDVDGTRLCPRFQITGDPSPAGSRAGMEILDMPITQYTLRKSYDASWDTHVVDSTHYTRSQENAKFHIFADPNQSDSNQHEVSLADASGVSTRFDLSSITVTNSKPSSFQLAVADPATGSMTTDQSDYYSFEIGSNGNLALPDYHHFHLLPQYAPDSTSVVKFNGESSSVVAGHSRGVNWYTSSWTWPRDGGIFNGYYVIDEYQAPIGFLWPHDDDGNKLCQRFQVCEVMGLTDEMFEPGADTVLEVVDEPIRTFEIQKIRDGAYTYDSGDDHYENNQVSATFNIYAAEARGGTQSEANCITSVGGSQTFSLPKGSWTFASGSPDKSKALVDNKTGQLASTTPVPLHTGADGRLMEHVHLLPDGTPTDSVLVAVQHPDTKEDTYTQADPRYVSGGVPTGVTKGFHGYYVIDETQSPKGYMWPHDNNGAKLYPLFQVKRDCTEVVGFLQGATTGISVGDDNHNFVNEPIAEFELQKQRDEAYTYDSGDAHFDNKQNAAIFTIYSAAFTGNEQNDENCTVGTFALPTKLADGQTSTWTYVHGKPDKNHAVSERAVKTDPWEGWSLWTKDTETPYQFVTDDNGLIRDIHLIPDCAPAAYGGYQGFHGYYVVDEIQAPEGYLWPHADNAEKLYPMFHIIRGQTRVVGFSPTSTTGLSNGDDEHNFVDEPYGEFALHKVENPNYLYTQDDAHYNRSQGTNEPGDGNTTGAKFRIYADVTQAATGDTVKMSEAKADTEEVGWVFQHSQPDRQHALIDTATGRLGSDEQAVVLEPDAEGWIRDVHLLPESAPAAYLNVDPKTGVHQAEAQSEFSNGVYDGFHGWYVIDEFESPQGYIYPHDDDGNQVFPRFHIARGETKVVGWTEENANSDKTPDTKNGTTIGVGVEGDNPHPFYDEGLAKFELHKLGDSAYTYIEGDEQTDEKQDGHFRVDQNGAVFNIYADQNQTSSQNVMQTPSGSWKFDTGQPDWTHAVSGRAIDLSDWRNWTLWTREGEDVHDFTTTDGGWIKDVHLIADTTPAKYGGYDGFHGYYVLDEVDCPTGYLVPHAEDGAKIYPRFHVARNQTDVSGFSDQAYSGNANVKVEAGVTEPAENEHAFIDQPIGEFELNKKYNAEFDSMVKNGDGGEGDPAYDPTFADATFNIYVDKNQGDVEGTVSGPYWTVQAGTPDMQHALIDRRTGKMGPDTPETELTVLENNRTLKNGYLNLANEDGELWIRDIHLLPGGAPDMSERTAEKGTLQPGAKANIDTNLYTDLNHTFKGWYVIDEVIWPKGFMWPHASNGQKLYPRFQIAYDELDTVGYFGTGESGTDVDVENGAMGPFYDEAISVFNLHKTVDEAQQPPAGDKNYSSANPENAEQVNGINTVFKIYADTNQNKEAPSYTPFEGATAYTTGTRDFNAVVVDRNTGRVAPDNYQHASNTALPDLADEAEKAEFFVVDENGWVKDIHLLPAETSEDLFSGMPDSAPRYHATAMRLPKDSNGVFQGYYVLDEVQRAAGYLFPHDQQGNQLYPRFQVVRGQADPEFSYDLINEIQVPVQIVKTRDADYNEMIDGTDDEAEPQVSGQVREDEETQAKKGDAYYSLVGAKVKIFADQDQTIDDRLYGNPTKTLDDGTIVSLGVKGPYSAEMVASEYGPYDKNGLWYKSETERVPGQMADEGAEPIDDVYVFETQELNGKAVINAYLLPSESSDQFFTNNGIDLTTGQQTEEPTAEYPHGYSYGAARFQLPRDEKGVFNGYYVLAEVEAPSGYLRVHDANGNLLYPRFRVTRGDTTVATPLYNEAEGHTGVTKLTTDTYQLVVKDDEGKANPNYTLAGAKVRIYPDVDQKTKMGEEERPFFGTPDWKYAFYNEQGYVVDVTEYLKDVSYHVNTASDGSQQIYYQEVDENALLQDTGLKLQTFVTDEEGKFVAHLPSVSGGIVGHPDFNGYYVVDELVAPKGYLLPHVDEGLDKGQKLYPRFCVANEDTRIANEDKGQVLPDLPYGGYDGDHEDVDSRNGGHAIEYHDDPARVFFSAVKVDPTMLDPNTNEIVFDPDTHDPIHNKNAALAGAQFELRDSNNRTWAGVSDRNGHVEFYTEEFATLLTQIQDNADLKAEYRALLDNEEIEDFPSALIQFGLNHGYNFAPVYIPLGHFKITEVANPIGFRVPEQPVVAEGDITSDDVERYQKDLGDLYLTPSGSEFHYGNYDVTDQRYWTEDESFTPTDQRPQYEFSCTQCKHAEYRNVESIEEGFVCPVCGADAKAFELIKQTNTFDNNDIKAFDISLKKVKPSDYGDMDSYHDADMQTPMKGVHFEIYRLNSLDDREGELVGTMVTGSDGVATTYNYPSGVEWDADPDNPVADWELYDRYGNCLLSRDQGILPTDGTRLWLSDGNPIDSTLTSDGVRGALAYTLYGYRIHELPINVDDELRLSSDIIIKPQNQVDGYTYQVGTILNYPVTHLQFIKIDQETGEVVPAKGFTFELYEDFDEDGAYTPEDLVTQVTTYPRRERVGQWTTDETGQVTMPAPLKAGKYIVHEVSCGDVYPYIISENTSVDFHPLHPTTDFEVITTEFPNKSAYGHVQFRKVDKDTGEPIEGAVFKIRAAEDIKRADGSIAVPEGSFVSCKGTDSAVITLVSGPDGTAKCCDGEHEDGCLPIDATDGVSEYDLVEVKAADGYSLPDEPTHFQVKYENDQTPDVMVNLGDIENEALKIQLTKASDEVEHMSLPGASYMLWDSGDVMEPVVEVPQGKQAVNIILQSGNGPVGVRPHVGNGGVATTSIEAPGYVTLAPDAAAGESYVLVQNEQQGIDAGTYQVIYHASDVADETTVIDTIEVKTGDAINVKLDETGTPVIEQTTVTDTGLVTPQEIEAHPGTYELALNPGVYDVFASGTLVSETSPLVVTDSDVTYFAGEGDVPAGRWIKDLVNSDAPMAVETTEGEEGKLIYSRLGHWGVDTVYHFAEVNPPDGYTVDHTVYEIRVGADNQPVFVEMTAAEQRANNQNLVVADGGRSLTVFDAPTRVQISKQDATTGEEIEGAHLTVFDSEDNVVEEWVSGTSPHIIEGLKPGKYTLREVITPRTHEKANDVTFEVNDDGNVVEQVVMFDEEIKIDAEIDKRQEIANPPASDYEANGDGASKAETQINKDGTYDYSLDYRSKSTTWTDEFTVQDDLDMATKGYAYLEGITTAQGGEDYNGLMNVWYKTNKDDELIAIDKAPEPESNANATKDGHEKDNPWLTDESVNGPVLGRVGDDLRVIDYRGWHLWQADVPTDKATNLSVADLGLAKDEYVTGFRFEYGRVAKDFTTRQDRWNEHDPMIKNIHDDVNEVASQNKGTFKQNGKEVAYAPAQIHMRATAAYTGEARIDNAARVDAYRNGGVLPGDEEGTHYGDLLEGHDVDQVTQVPKSSDVNISGKLDKRQEIADPTADRTEANGDGKNTAATTVSEDGFYDYSLDFVNTSSTWVDEFTITDSLDAVKDNIARLTGVTTPKTSEDFDGLVNVWYKTKASSSYDRPDSDANQTLDDGHVNEGVERQLSYAGYRLWKAGVSLSKPEVLNVSDLNILDGDYVTDIRFEFGRVEPGFTSRTGLWDRDDLYSEHDDVADVPSANEEGYAPIIVHMQVTPDYVEGKPLNNSAVLDLYRLLNGSVLGGHDKDAVTQTPKLVVAVTPGDSTSDVASYKVTSLLDTGIPALMVGFAAIGGIATITYTIRRVRNRNRE